MYLCTYIGVIHVPSYNINRINMSISVTKCIGLLHSVCDKGITLMNGEDSYKMAVEMLVCKQ